MSSDPVLPPGFRFVARVQLKGEEPTVLLYSVDDLVNLLNKGKVRYVVARGTLHRVRIEVWDVKGGERYYVYYDFLGEHAPRSIKDAIVVHDSRKFDQVEDVMTYLYKVFHGHRDKPVRFELAKKE